MVNFFNQAFLKLYFRSYANEICFRHPQSNAQGILIIFSVLSCRSYFRVLKKRLLFILSRFLLICGQTNLLLVKVLSRPSLYLQLNKIEHKSGLLVFFWRLTRTIFILVIIQDFHLRSPINFQNQHDSFLEYEIR